MEPAKTISQFIVNQNENILEIRSDVDVVKRGYALAYSERISKLEFNRYKDNVEACGDSADMKL